MSALPLVKFRADDAAVVCKSIRRLSPAARALLASLKEARAFLDVVVARELWPDAIKFLAYALRKREAVWWGCLCAWQARDPEPPPAELAALRAAATWVTRPTDDRRRAADTPAQQVGPKTAAGNLASAAFFSSGNVAAQGLPAIEAPPHLTHRLVAVALTIAAAAARDRTAQYQSFVALGIAIAQGKHPWPTDVA